MNPHTTNLDRPYVCPSCASTERAPLHGGHVTCSRCHATDAVPDRSTLPVNLATQRMPPDNPARIQSLHAQERPPRPVPPALQAALDGMNAQSGREQQMLALWQSRRARSRQGDVAASEELTVLTRLIVQMPAMARHAHFCEALSESAYDAGVLPRHKQEQLGRLVRIAVGRGDRARAQRYLGWMVGGAPDLDVDTEVRLAAAAVATLEHDAQRALALLGPRRYAIPIADAMDPLASVLRANAYERLGDATTAAQILRELSYPRMLAAVTAQFPALQLCPQSGPAYAAAVTREAAKRAASRAGGWAPVVAGLAVALFGGLLTFMSVTRSLHNLTLGLYSPASLGTGGACLIGGLAVAVYMGMLAKHAAWLQMNGISLAARVVAAECSPGLRSKFVYRYTVKVAGPQGPYDATFDRRTRSLMDDEMPVGREIRVRANPRNLLDVFAEE